MTDFLSKISQRVRDNVKDWYEKAGVAPGPDGKRDGVADEARAFENLKLMASLMSEGIPARECSALNLVFASNNNVSVSALIKVARDKRADPAIKEYLNLLKETLLPPPSRPKPEKAEDMVVDLEAEKVQKQKAEEQVLKSARLVYESTAIAHTLLATFGKELSKSELESATERFERVLGRKLNDEEKFA
jgi:hypothetical protein